MERLHGEFPMWLFLPMWSVGYSPYCRSNCRVPGLGNEMYSCGQDGSQGELACAKERVFQPRPPVFASDLEKHVSRRDDELEALAGLV